MGQFGNLISCAKEEICLNTDYSPELMFQAPRFLLWLLFASKRTLFWMENNAPGGKGTP